MATGILVKHVCDKCGNSETKEVQTGTWYPKEWQHISLGQTGAELDLCEACNHQLITFLEMDGASNMRLACVREGLIL